VNLACEFGSRREVGEKLRWTVKEMWTNMLETGGSQTLHSHANSFVSVQGDPFAQSRLGLSYDKGHGVPQDVVLAYKWLDLAAAHATRRKRDYYLRLRNAVASKMSTGQIVEGQRLALYWAPGRW